MNSEHIDVWMEIQEAVNIVYHNLNSHCVTTTGLPFHCIKQQEAQLLLTDNAMRKPAKDCWNSKYHIIWLARWLQEWHLAINYEQSFNAKNFPPKLQKIRRLIKRMFTSFSSVICSFSISCQPMDISCTVVRYCTWKWQPRLKWPSSVVEGGTNRKLVYDFLLVLCSNFCHIMHHLWEIWCETV